MKLPDCLVVEAELPFTVDTDIVEIDMPINFSPISLTLNGTTIIISALAAAGGQNRPARFRRYTAGQTVAGIDLLNVALSTTPKFLGSVPVDGHLWHIVHEPTPNVPGMDALIQRFTSAPNTPPMSGAAGNA